MYQAKIKLACSATQASRVPVSETTRSTDIYNLIQRTTSGAHYDQQVRCLHMTKASFLMMKLIQVQRRHR